MHPGQEGEEAAYRGICVDGPLDQQWTQSRFPSGFIAVDRRSGRVWVYDRQPDKTPSQFRCREVEGRVLDYSRIEPAAEGTEFDVRAIDTTGEGE